MISTAVLRQIAPQANQTICDGLEQYLPAALEKYQINTLLRVAHFLAQCAEESAGFRTLTEYASGSEYEGRHDLGNTVFGDGVRFKGRGLLQITGRYNYASYGKKIGVDLVDQPALAALPQNSVLTACQYWSDHGLNAYADRDDLLTITKRINGGTNGLVDRQLYLARAKKVISAAEMTAEAAPASVATRTALPTTSATPAAPRASQAASNPQPGFWSWLHSLLSRKS